MTKRQCDALWSTKVRSRGKCAVCGHRYGLVAHHLVPRRNKEFRCDFDNGLCLCYECHTGSSDFSAHLTPARFRDWMEETLPEQYDLWQRRKNMITVTSVDWTEVWAELNKKDFT